MSSPPLPISLVETIAKKKKKKKKWEVKRALTCVAVAQSMDPSHSFLPETDFDRRADVDDDFF